MHHPYNNKTSGDQWFQLLKKTMDHTVPYLMGMIFGMTTAKMLYKLARGIINTMHMYDEQVFLY